MLRTARGRKTERGRERPVPKDGVTMYKVSIWVERHPYKAFALFLAITFGLMALAGVNDGPDRVNALRGL